MKQQLREEDRDFHTLAEFFPNPDYKKPVRHITRVHYVVKYLEAREYGVNRVGRTWEIFHNKLNPGVTAIYNRLDEINLKNPI